MNKEEKHECSNLELQRQASLWALSKGSSESEPQDMKLAEHIHSCPSCQKTVLDWKRKSLGWNLWEDARRIVKGVIQADEQVDAKAMFGGKVFFRHPRTAGESGLLIMVNHDGDVQSIDAMATMSDFENIG